MSRDTVRPSASAVSLASLLRAWRQRALLSQEELAERAGLSVGTIRGVESGRIRRPRGATVRYLADALGLVDRERATLVSAAGGNLLVHPGLVPAQLPATVPGFTGRVDALDSLDATVPADTVGTPAVVVVVAGMAGVGKTALAVHWGRRVAARFPDGQLHINLRGYAAGPPVRPIDVLAWFLRALGVDAERVPVELDEAVGLYRSVLAGRRVLVLLDNARDAEQVRPLLPASPGCLALVTSRDRLTGLVALQNARRLTLEVLAPSESVALLTGVLGRERAAAEPDAVLALAEACGHLPLALCIAAANLTERSHPDIDSYVDALCSDRALTELEVSGDAEASVRAAFTLSLRHLGPDGQRIFQLLSIGPGPDVTPEAAAALAVRSPDRTRDLLDVLSAAHLVRQDQPGRYALHDLLRRYARELADGAAAVDDEPTAALERLCDYYLRTIGAAAKLLYPQTVRIPVDDGAADAFPDETAALAWLDAERPNLIATIQHVAEHGPAQMAWLLADALRGYFWISRTMTEWLAASEAGLAAAKSRGDPYALAAMHLNFGMAHRSRGRYRSSLEHFDEALALARSACWREAQASILVSVGVSHAELGDPAVAVERFGDALALNRLMGRRAGEAVALGNMSMLRNDLGDLGRSNEDGLAALALYRETGNPGGEGIALTNLGINYVHLGQIDHALDHLTRGLAIHDRMGDAYGQIVAHGGLTQLHIAVGRYDAATEHGIVALTLARETGDRSNEAAVLVALATIHCARGETDLARQDYETAIRLAREVGSLHPEADALIGLAEVGERDGRLAEALTCAQEAIALAAARGYRMLEGRALTAASRIHLAARRTVDAVRTADQAVANHRATGYRLGEARAIAALARAVSNVDDVRRHRRAAVALFTAIHAPVPAELIDTHALP